MGGLMRHPIAASSAGVSHRRGAQLLRKSVAFVMMLGLLVVYVIWTADDFIQPALSDMTAVNDSAYLCAELWFDGRPTGDTSGHPTSTSTPTSATSAAPTTAGWTVAARLPIIYFVTPTYPRREQIAELTRLGQTLMHVPHLHWIVADDFDGCNAQVDRLLRRMRVPFTHLASPMPDAYRSMQPIPRGVANRRAAIRWLRANGRRPGVLYFGDDDNTFDLRLFEEIRNTTKVSMFPVGLIGQYGVSAPVVREGKVIGFYDSWPAKRQWPVDMAGFAVSLGYLERSPNATMPYRAGYEEDEFLQNIGLRLDDIEPRASNCTEVLVWHTQTKKDRVALVRLPLDGGRVFDSQRTSLGPLLRTLDALNVGRLTARSDGVVPQLSSGDGHSKPIGKAFF